MSAASSVPIPDPRGGAGGVGFHGLLATEISCTDSRLVSAYSLSNNEALLLRLLPTILIFERLHEKKKLKLIATPFSVTEGHPESIPILRDQPLGGWGFQSDEQSSVASIDFLCLASISPLGKTS